MSWHRNEELVPTLVDAEFGLTLTPQVPDAAHLDRLTEMCQDADSQYWVPLPRPYTPEHARGYLTDTIEKVERGEQLAWAMFVTDASLSDEQPGRYVGNVDLRLQDAGRGEIGCMVHPDSRGHGLMAQATRMVCEWGFTQLGMNVIVWRAIAGNIASRRTAQSAGFHFDGTTRRAIEHRGQWVDAYLGTLLPDEPRHVQVPRIPELDEGAAHSNDTSAPVRLRRFTHADLPTVQSAFTDSETQHWFPDLVVSFGRQEAEECLLHWHESELAGSTFAWAICDDDVCVGGITLYGVDNRAGHGELGYWVAPGARGHGYAGRAARIVADTVLGSGPLDVTGALSHRADSAAPPRATVPWLQSLQVRCAPENGASIRAAVAAGFTPTGRQPRAELLRDGSRPDLLLYSRAREPVVDRYP